MEGTEGRGGGGGGRPNRATSNIGSKNRISHIQHTIYGRGYAVWPLDSALRAPIGKYMCNTSIRAPRDGVCWLNGSVLVLVERADPECSEHSTLRNCHTRTRPARAAQSSPSPPPALLHTHPPTRHCRELARRPSSPHLSPHLVHLVCTSCYSPPMPERQACKCECGRSTPGLLPTQLPSALPSRVRRRG